MISKLGGKCRRTLPKSLMFVGLGLALCAYTLPASAQENQPDRSGQSQATVPSQDSQAQNQSPAAPQPQQQPDAQPQGPPDEQSDAQAQTQPNQAAPPQTLTLPAGTVVRVRVDEWVSTDRNVTGDDFSAVLDQPIVVNGWVVARRGQAQTGRVSFVKKGQAGGASQLGLDLPELTLVDGQQVPLQTQLFQASAGANRGQDVAIIGSTTGMGALIGAIAGRGVGAAIGAGIGATAGAIGVMSTPGNPTVIPPETVLSFRLDAPVTISTSDSQLAFQPVTQSDYDSHSAQSRPRMNRPGPPPPSYYPYPYAYGYPYPWYPAPFVGFGYYGRFGGYRP